MASKKARVQELYDLADGVVKDYGARDVMLDELEDYYFLEGDKDEDEEDDEEGIEVVRQPHGTNVIDLMQDLLSGADLSITVPAKSDGPTDKKLADVAEQFLWSVWRQSARAQRQGMVGRAAWLVAMRGAGCARVFPVTKWLKASDNGKTSFEVGEKLPILIQLRDPRHVYPRFGLDGLDYVVEKRTRTVEDVRRSYGDDVLPKKKAADNVDWLEYWDGSVYMYWADGAPVKRKAGAGPWLHLCGGNPYAYEFARQTGKTEPEYRARPTLKAVTGPIDKLDLLDSMAMTFVSHYIGTAWKVISDDEDLVVSLKPGAINRLRMGDDIVPLQGGRQAPELEQLRAKFDATLQKGTFPDAMFGDIPGVMAGYALNMLNQSGQIRIKPVVSCLEQLLESVFSNVLMVSESLIADVIGGPIPFSVVAEEEDESGDKFKARNKQTFDAAKLDGVYWVDVQLGELMPADEQANVMIATRARAENRQGRPLLSDETIWNKFNLATSAGEERSRIDRQLAWDDPEIVELRRAIAVATVKQELADELTALDINPDEVLARAQQKQQPPPQPQPMPQMQPAPPPMMPGVPPEAQLGPMGEGQIPPELLMQMAGGMEGMPPEMMGGMPPPGMGGY